MNSWQTQINDNSSNPILRTYCSFKTEYRKEPYLYQVANRHYLTAISRFRTSSHSLHIETGRHTIPFTPPENRICNFCQLNCIDNEEHMLLYCPFHNEERTLFLQYIQNFTEHSISVNNRDLFVIIMQSRCPDMVNALGKYLSVGFLRRKTTQSP